MDKLNRENDRQIVGNTETNIFREIILKEVDDFMNKVQSALDIINKIEIPQARNILLARRLLCEEILATKTKLLECSDLVVMKSVLEKMKMEFALICSVVN